MLDLALIKTPDDFELFCEDILKSIGFTIISRPARGPGQGKDIICSRIVDDEFDGRITQRFLVECKHFAASGKSVYESDTKNIIERTFRNDCDHYLLITSTEAGVTVRDQIEAINNNEKINIRATSWYKNDLVKKIYADPIIWEFYTGQKIKPQSKPTYFQDLESFFKFGSKFSPNESLLLKGLFYLSSFEKSIIDSLKNKISLIDNNKLFVLCGPPASGKTVLTIILAKLVEEDGGSAFFHRVTTKSQIKELWSDIVQNDFENNIFIFENCHLNIEIPNNIYANSHLIKNAACLFVSRDISDKVRFSPELDNLDYFDSLNENIYSLVIEQGISSKTTGIINKYKDYYEKLYKKQFNIGDLNKIFNTIRGNFLALNYFLEEWPEVVSLDQVNKIHVLEKIYQRYLSRPTWEILLKYAALFQYEISFEPPQEEMPVAELLLTHGILSYDSSSEFFGFYHSDFAKLLIESYECRPSFKRKFADKNEFSLFQIKSYILSFNNYPPNFHEIISNLILFGNSPILKKMLGDQTILEICVKYYLSKGTLSQIYQFLSFIHSMNSESFSILSKKLLIDNTMIKSAFLNSDLKLSFFIKTINLLETIGEEYRSYFIELFSINDIEAALFDTPIIAIASDLSTLRREDSIRSTILNLMTMDYLAHEMKKIRLIEIARAYSALSKLNYEKAQESFKSISSKILAEKAAHEYFSDISFSINSLMKIDKKHSENIFSNIPTDLLVTKAKQHGVSFIGLSRSLSDFNKIDVAKTNQILQHLEVGLFLKKFNVVDLKFSLVAQGLALLNNLTNSVTKELLSNIPISKLLESVQNESLISFAQAINNIYKIDIKIARKIILKTDIIALLKKIPNEKRLKIVLSKALSEINNVDEEKAWEILNYFKDAHLIRYLTFDVKNIAEIGNALRVFKRINSRKARLICESLSTSELKIISEKGGLNALILGLNSINKVDKKKSKELLNILNLDVIIEKAYQKRTSFETLAKLLLVFHKINPQKTNILCKFVDYKIMIEKANDSKLKNNKILNLIKDLQFIENLNAERILKGIKI